MLKQRFAEFGSEGVLFLDELVRTRRCGKDEAARLLGLLATYHREDLARALCDKCPDYTPAILRQDAIALASQDNG